MTSRRSPTIWRTLREACGFEPIVTARDDEFREAFSPLRPEMVALDLGMPVDGVELTGSSPIRTIAAPS